jgi:hypothetical protein
MNHEPTHFDDEPASPSQPDRVAGEPRGELSEADLECVVGGLARPWTEAEVDQWLVKQAATLL